MEMVDAAGGRQGGSLESSPAPGRKRPSVAKAIVRDALVALLFVVLLLGTVWGYTGQSFPSRAPIVVVESGSMMRPEAGYGRLNSIDPGDLVLVKDVGARHDIDTADAEGARRGYGGPGDVIVYRPYGDPLRTPIIHRAVAWVEVEQTPAGPRFTVLEWGIVGVESVSYAPRNVNGWHPAHSGFITQGDNPATNARPDQATNPMLSPPVKPDWIIGKARGEIPWLGLMKLALSGTPPAPTGGWCTILLASAPCDSWTMLGVSVGGLASIPLAWDPLAALLGRWRKRRAD